MRTITRRGALITGAAALPAFAMPRITRAQDLPVIRVGQLVDLSGPYRDTSGTTSVACAQQAIEDFKPETRGFRVELLPADHQNNPDISMSTVRQWLDRSGVDMVLEVNNSAIALAIATLVQEKDKVHLNTGAVSADLTGKACSPNMIHWTYDSWMLAHAAATSVVRQGGDTWFIIAPDYAFGVALTRDTTTFVEQAGGKVLGTLRHPFPGVTDFSSYLLQAQASGAKVIGLANGGADIVNCVKQAHEFGLQQKGIRIVAMVGQTTDAHALGLDSAQGLVMNGPFYWDLNERTRAFTQRVLPKTPSNYPNMEHAGTYSAMIHYMKTIAQIGPAAAKASGRATVDAMKKLPTDDDAFGAGSIRADGRKIHADYVFQVKTPGESKQPWDVYKLIDTIPASEAFRPIDQGNCALSKT